MFVRRRGVVTAVQLGIVCSLTLGSAACGEDAHPQGESPAPSGAGDNDEPRDAGKSDSDVPSGGGSTSLGASDVAARPDRGKSGSGDAGRADKDAGRQAADSGRELTKDASQPAPDAGRPPGTVRDLLVPVQGALLGMFFGAERRQATETKLGRSVPVHLTYVAWNDDWPNEAAKPDIAAERTPLINLEPSDAKLDELVKGTYDAVLTKHAKSVKALEKPIFLDFAAEMNGNWSTWDGSHNGKNSAVYIAAYRHLHDVLVAGGASNIVWLWCPNVESEPNVAWNAAMAYYPGDDYVDWTCVDGYNWGTTNGGGWQSFKQVFSGIYKELAAKGKPIMIGEMASTEEGGDKAAWIDAIVPTLRTDYPLIKALVWFDIDKETDWRISSSPTAQSAFVKMANDPYFNP
jgi:hypothetical protein